MAAPESATSPADISTGSAAADVSVDLVNLDQVNGQLVNVQVSGVHVSVVPPVSLTLRLTRGTQGLKGLKEKRKDQAAWLTGL